MIDIIEHNENLGVLIALIRQEIAVYDKLPQTRDVKIDISMLRLRLHKLIREQSMPT
jgi:hypothetical protein